MNRERRTSDSSRAVEPLEARLLLAVGAGDVKHGARAKLGMLAGLRQEYLDYVAANGSGAGFVPQSELLVIQGDGLAIEALVDPRFSPKTLATKLTNRQMKHATRFANGVAGVLPFGALSSVSLLNELKFARPVLAGTRAGSVTSQTDPAVRGDIARSTLGYTGSGVQVGILSDSFNANGTNGYADDITSGDLPAGVTVLQDLLFGSDEGRAMAQLVHDSAPGASLSFATAYTGQSGFADNIRALRDNGADVIVDDIFYYDEPFYQDGVIAQAVDEVVADGVPYFSAAGNEGRDAYEAPFRDSGIVRLPGAITGSGPLTFWGGESHDFDPGPGVDDMQQFQLPPSGLLLLSFQWDQPYGSVPDSAGCASDIDIYVLNADGTQILAESAIGNIDSDPIEIFDFRNPFPETTAFQIMIVRYEGDSPGIMKYVDFGGDATFDEYATHSGTIFGHSNAAGAAAVGAAPWYGTPAFGMDPPTVESFSSRGPMSILFDDAGNRVPEIVRPKPDFVAPDGGNTTFFAVDDQDYPPEIVTTLDPDTLPNFYGTSAAAPVAAAVAAMMLQANPWQTPGRVYSTLASTAQDMDDPFTPGFDAGFDSASGAGLIRADAAVNYAARNLVFTDTIVTLNASYQLDSLTIDNSTVTLAADGSRMINTGTLSITGTSTLDLSDNDLIVRSGTLDASVCDEIITSQTAAFAQRGRTTIAVSSASLALGIDSAQTAVWQGETVAGGAVLLKYTYLGDMNLDGRIDGDDYARIDAGFSAQSAGYANGDLNRDGKIDADDYFGIDLNYAAQQSPL